VIIDIGEGSWAGGFDTWMKGAVKEGMWSKLRSVRELLVEYTGFVGGEVSPSIRRMPQTPQTSSTPSGIGYT